MAEFKPDPGYFKNTDYPLLWPKHNQHVRTLESELIKRFPQLEGCIKIGHGADTDKLLKIPPEFKYEPDLRLYFDYKPFCYIEVSGSGKIYMPQDIWIKQGKIETAESLKTQYFFYMVYNNEIRVISIQTAQKYKEKMMVKYLKTNKTTGKKIAEKFCAVPYGESQPTEQMFGWLEEKLNSYKHA